MTIHDFYARFSVSKEEQGRVLTEIRTIDGTDTFDAIAILAYILASRLEEQAKEIQELKRIVRRE